MRVVWLNINNLSKEESNQKALEENPSQMQTEQ